MRYIFRDIQAELRVRIYILVQKGLKLLILARLQITVAKTLLISSFLHINLRASDKNI
jgi:hypothetical protein